MLTLFFILTVTHHAALQLRTSKQELREFSYKPFPPESYPVRVEWQLLKSADVERDHIRVHELMEEELAGEGEGLLAVLQNYKAGRHVKAVVLISTDETLGLLESAGRKFEWLAGYPVAVITRSDGDQLLECLNVQYKDEELHAQLVVKSVEELQEYDMIEDDVDLPSSGAPFAKHESHKGEYQRPSLLQRQYG